LGHLTLKVVPGSKKPGITFENCKPNSHRPLAANEPALTVRLREKAQGNEANIALCKHLTRLSGDTVRILRGARSRIKVIAFGIDADAFMLRLREACKA